MANVIVGIHGLANKPERNKLANWWTQSIREGLEKNCNMPDPDFEFKMVYWADLLYKNHLHEDDTFDFDSLYNEQPHLPAREGALKKYRDGWVDDARALILGVGGAAIDALKRHVGMDALADAVLNNVLKDLGFYYDKNRQILDHQKEKSQARHVLMGELRRTLIPLAGRPIMLIAHSMGSIIAYDMLRNIGRENPAFSVAHFVTIGSPLGLPHVKAKVYEERSSYSPAVPVRTPTIVTEKWVNYADRKDMVAFDVHLRDDYGPNDRGIRVEDDLVINDYTSPTGERNHHKSYGYLRTPELSEHIRDFITA